MSIRRDTGLDAEDLALLVDAIEDYAIFLLGPEGEIRSWNSGAARTMGYTADEIIGSNFSRFYGPEDLAARKPQNELLIASREGLVEDEGWRVRKDGVRFWANTIIRALRDPAGRVTGFAKVTRDLTRRREAEEHLRRSEEMFRLLVESVKEYAIFLLDAQGRVATWNAGAQRIKGYTPEEIIGRHFSTFYSEEDRKDRKPERELEIATAEGSVEDEGWRIRKDGTRFWANVVITAVHDDKGELRGFAKVTRDMTERKRTQEMQLALFQQREARLIAEEERRRAEASSRVAQEANRAKDAFLMTLSHELRTPLTAILGWSRLLPVLPPQEPSFRDAVAAIGRAAELQARLIDDVLDVSRIVSGKLRLSIESIDLADLVRGSVEAVRPSAEAKGITLTASLSPGLGTISADITRMQQIIWNLLTNAVKFTPRDGRITVDADRTATAVRIRVTDSGEGIDPSFLPHVFEPFRQAENPSTRVHGGLGLGLSIVRYLAEAHGGTVAAESTGRGQGATFTVTLPVGVLPAEVAPQVVMTPAAPARPEPLPQKLAGVPILLVDDDTDSRGFFRLVLTRAGADVTDVESGSAALEALDHFSPRIVVTDIAMPRMDGHALAREIRQRKPDLKIVALSAFPAGRSGGQESAFNGHITKPVEPGDLIDEIARVLQMH